MKLSNHPKFRKTVPILVWVTFVAGSTYGLYLLSVFTRLGYVGYFLAGVISLLEYSLTDRILDRILGIEVPILSFEPLELTPETKFNPIQFLTLAWASGTVKAENGKIVGNTIKQNQLEAKFAILRVRNMGSDAENCQVTMRHEVKAVHSRETTWLPDGNVNWYSDSKRNKVINWLRTQRDFRIDSLGFLFDNSKEDIYKGKPMYLQLGFIQKEGPTFWISTDSNTSPFLSLWDLPNWEKEIPKAPPTMTNHLSIELTITARNYPVTKKFFDLSITKDRIKIDAPKEIPVTKEHQLL